VRQRRQEALRQTQHNCCSVVNCVAQMSFQSTLKQVEEALHPSEAQLRRLVENVPGVIYQYRQYPDGTDAFTYVSSGIRELFELEPELVEQSTELMWASIHPDDLGAFMASVGHSAQTLEQWRMEWRITTPSGILKWVQGMARLERQPNGILIWDGIVWDISDKKQAEAALRDSETNFRQMAESIRECFWMSDAEMTRLLYVSPAYAKIYGRSCQSAYERPDTWLEAVHPEDRQQIINSWERLLGGETVELEYRVIRPDGSLVWVLDRTFPVWNYRGEIYRLAGIALDISDSYRQATQRKQQEKALQQQKELLQTIFDHIPVMVAFHDANGQIQLINRELERVLGWSLAELDCRDLLTFCYPNPKSRQRVVKHLLAATGEWQDFKTRTREGYVLDTSWASIRLSDGTSISIGQDVTKRKRTEEVLRSLTQQQRVKALQLEQALTELQHTQAQLVQNEKMASLGQLVAGVAHEINNPTSFIYGNIPPALEYTSNLLRLIALYQQHYLVPVPKIQAEIDAIDLDFIKQDFPKLLHSIHEGASRIQGIVKSLRNFSHIDATQPKTTDLHQGLDSTLMILRTRLKEQPHRVAIQVIKQYGDLPLVQCYPGELNQVLMNILGNAIDAIEQKIKEEANFTPQIRICTEVVRVSEKTTQMQHSTDPNKIQTFLTQPQIQSVSSSGRTFREPKSQHLKSQLNCADKVVIRIADNGTGIPPEVQRRVFDPFFTSKPVGQGTGLGLSISHTIVVKKHRGRLYCNSQYEKGTEFTIELPLQ
jgi:PAS domain S-box-containing protein